MPLERLPYTPDCSKFKVTTVGGQDTGQRVLKTFPGRKNVDLGDGTFEPYVWDEPSQSIRYGNLSCEFDVDGFQTIREYGSIETLIDEQQFEVQYWRTQGGGSWRVLDLWQIGLTVDQQDEQCTVTRNLSDGLGNTLDVDFLFRPHEKVKNTFRLHVVDASLIYRIRFQNTGIAGEVTEVPYIDRTTQNNLGIYKLLFENIKFEWDSNEINLHSYAVEDQAGGKKLDIFISDFVLDANGDVIISPDTWGPTTTSADGTEEDNSIWNANEVLAGNFFGEALDAGMQWTITDVDLPGATINVGTKITADVVSVEGAGVTGLLKIVDDRTPGVFGSSNRPSQMLPKHSTTVVWNEASTGSRDSPELNAFVQQRIDGEIGAAFESGDIVPVIWEDNGSGSGSFTESANGGNTLTLVYTPSGGGETFYQNTGQGAMAIVGVLSKKITFVTAMGGHSVSIAGTLNKKTTPVTAMGGHSMSITGTLNKKTTPVTTMGGHSMSIVGSLTKAAMFTQDTGGHAMTITGVLTTVVTFVRAVGGHAMTIVGTLLKKTSTGVGAGQVSSTGILSKKTSKDVGGGSVTSIGTLDATILFTQAVGGASMSIVGSLATQFIAGTGVVAAFIRRRKTFYKQ